MIRLVEEVRVEECEQRSFCFQASHMACLVGSWRSAGWTGLSPESPKKRRVPSKQTAETGARLE